MLDFDGLNEHFVGRLARHFEIFEALKHVRREDCWCELGQMCCGAVGDFLSAVLGIFLQPLNAPPFTLPSYGRRESKQQKEDIP